MSLLKTLLAIESATVEITDDDAIVKTAHVTDDEDIQLAVTLESLSNLFQQCITLNHVSGITQGGEVTTSVEALLLGQVLANVGVYSAEDDTDSVDKALTSEKSSNFLVRGLKAIWSAITKSISWLFGKIADFFRWVFGIQKKIDDKVSEGLQKVEELEKVDAKPTVSESGKPTTGISSRLSIGSTPSKDLSTLQSNLVSLNTISAWMKSHYSKVFESLYRELVKYAESKDTDNVKFLEAVYDHALVQTTFKPVFKHESTTDGNVVLTTDPLVGDVVGEATWSRNKLKSVKLETPVETSDEKEDVSFEIPELAGVRKLYQLAESHSGACKPLQQIQQDFKEKVDKLQRIFEKRLGFDGDTFKGNATSEVDRNKQELLLRAYHLLVTMASTPVMPLAKLHLGVALRIQKLADSCLSHFKED